MIAGETIDDTEKHLYEVEKVMKNVPEAQTVITVAQEWGGYVILPLKPIEQRSRSADYIVNSMRPSLVSFPSFDAWPWSFSSGLPSIDDPSENSELKMVISTTDSYTTLLKEINEMRRKGEEQKLFRSLYHNLRLDNEVLAKLKINKPAVAKTISILFSGDDQLKFKKDGILYPITIESDNKPWTLDELYITNLKDERISIANFASLTAKAEPKELEHYNQMRSLIVSTDLNSSNSLEEAMHKLTKLADDNLPPSYKKSWFGIARTFHQNSADMSI